MFKIRGMHLYIPLIFLLYRIHYIVRQNTLYIHRSMEESKNNGNNIAVGTKRR